MKRLYRDDRRTLTVPRIALRPREAAESLGMSEKALWSQTAPRGPIPATKQGARTVYWVHQLQAYADAELARQQAAEQQATTEEAHDKC